MESENDKKYSSKLCQSKDNNKTSNVETLMLIIKANIGTGILVMPFIFKNVGLVLGTIFLFVVGLVCLHCMHIIVNSFDYLTKQRDEEEVDENCYNYENIIYLAMKEKFGSNSNVPAIMKFFASLASFFFFFIVKIICLLKFELTIEETFIYF